VLQDKPGLGEQALSKIAELGISSQVDEVEEINVDIRSDPAKLMQGEVDSVAITANSMVMKEDLRMETLEIQTGSVAINALSAIFGKIELTQPTAADARVVLTEEDINRALNSDYLRQKMQNLKVQVQGNTMTVDVLQAEIHLPGDGKMNMNADIFVRETCEKKELSVTAIPCLRENGRRISLEEILYAEGKGLSLEFATALFENVMELLDLRKFELSGIYLRLKNLDIQPEKVEINAALQVEQLPYKGTLHREKPRH
jgi:hypothetical protein